MVGGKTSMKYEEERAVVRQVVVETSMAVVKGDEEEDVVLDDVVALVIDDAFVLVCTDVCADADGIDGSDDATEPDVDAGVASLSDVGAVGPPSVDAGVVVGFGGDVDVDAHLDRVWRFSLRLLLRLWLLLSGVMNRFSMSLQCRIFNTS